MPAESTAPAPIPDTITAWGDRCDRPDDAATAALTARIRAWIDGAVPGWLDGSSSPSLRFGCVEHDGSIIVDAQLDQTGDSPRQGTWWVLRVTPTAITALATATGEAMSDWMEYADEQTVSTLVLADLDGDGERDVLVLKDSREGGAVRGDETLFAYVGGRARKVGEVDGNLDLLGIADAHGRVAVQLQAGYDSSPIRCVGARGGWTKCD